MNSSVCNLHRQRGFTMVEIMVALAVSLLLLAGVLQIFLSSKQAYRVQENLSRVQENGRFTTELLSHYIRMAGHRVIRMAGQRVKMDPYPARFPTSPPGREAITGSDNSGTNGSDTITVRFESDGTMRDCLGNGPIAANTIITNSFSISANNELVCTNGPLPPPAGIQTQPLIEGVQDMQILYGVVNGNNIGYVPAGSVPSWNNVVSVRISLLLQTLENNLTDAPQPYSYNGATVTPTTSDLRLRRVFTTTITLRNQPNVVTKRSLE